MFSIRDASASVTRCPFKFTFRQKARRRICSSCVVQQQFPGLYPFVTSNRPSQ